MKKVAAWGAYFLLFTVLAVMGLPASAAGPVDDKFMTARQLTWDRQTRDEGIASLREQAAAKPHRLDIREALGEVLCWRDDTRKEGLSLLRQVLEAEPQRLSARLVLAEVLSWSRDTRSESEALYRQALADHPDSAAARVGLGRLLSWRGELAASSTMYLAALQRDPASAEARMGLAEVQRWSGRSRSSLETLRQLDETDRNSPAARQKRGEAWLDLDRPARALAEFEALLEQNPDHEEARRQVEDLRRRLRPALELGITASTESGDPATSKLRTLTFPVAWTWGADNDWRYRVGGGVTFLENLQGSTRQTSLGGGLEGPLGLRLRLAVDASWHEFQDGDGEFTGRLALRVAAAERLDLVFGVRRDTLHDSRLAAGGETIAGIRYGPVLETAGYAGFTLRPGKRWDLSARMSQGSLAGMSVNDNDRQAVFAGFGRTFQWGQTRLRPGYAFAYMAYDFDLSGYPPDDLGGDGLSSPGAGGYFSPFRFINHMARLDATWESGKGTTYAAGGGLGRQQVDDSGTDGLGAGTTSADVYVGARWRLSPSVDLRARASFQNVAAAFDRTRLSLFLVRRF